LLHKLINQIRNKTGFITEEIRENNERTGFKIITSHNEEATLASTQFLTQIKVARYFVSIENLEKVLLPLQNFDPKDVLYIDEIGQMELFSKSFKRLVNSYLNSSNFFIGTISKVYTDNFIEQILSRNDIELVEIMPENRGNIYESIAKHLLTYSPTY